MDWKSQLRSADSKAVYKARVALLELGANATSLVLPLLDESNDALRREAAVILYGIHRQSPLPDQIRAKIRPLLAPHLAALM